MAKQKKFGTFGGVFTPSILTILGVIMYLRLPWIAGQAGLISTIGIVLVAHLISVSTGLSVSSIATDKKVKAGGTYYMISRSLGLPIGGTLGLALFVGLSFSVSLYLIGFAESFLSYWDFEVTKDSIRIAGTIILISVTVITFISTSLAIKTQYFIMTAIILSLLSIFFGKHDYTPVEPLIYPLENAAPFIVLFGIFFPAVTGFEAGVSMSGDLQDPKKSIPGGTISAIAIGLVVYIGLAFFFSYYVSSDLLFNDSNALLKISLIPELVIAGIWGATLSSAFGSILGAPRILQATSVDKITPRFFAKGYGSLNEPRNALLLTFFIAEAGILIGELDVIARIVSMFFITTYGFLNLSCAIESWASSDFRPDFKIPKSVSIIGAIASFVVMLQLDFIAMVGATIILGSLFLYLKKKELTLDTGDTWDGVWSSIVRKGLAKLSLGKSDPRNWRPNILLFSGSNNLRPHLVDMGKWLAGKLGIISNFHLQEDVSSTTVIKKLSAEDNLYKDEEGIFTENFICRNVYEGIDVIARVYGFSGIEPNAVLMGWGRNTKDPAQFIKLVSNFNELDLNSLFLHYNKEKEYGQKKSIDVWWRGAGNNFTLILALVRYITSNPEWREATVRFIIISNYSSVVGKAHNNLNQILEQYRIPGKVKVINNEIEQRPPGEIIQSESAFSDLTIFGIPEVTEQNAAGFIDSINKLTGELGTTLLVHASSYFDEIDVGIKKGYSLIVTADSTYELAELKAQKNIAAEKEIVNFNGKYEHIVKSLFNQCTDRLITFTVSPLEELKTLALATYEKMNSIKGLHKSYYTRLREEVLESVDKIIVEQSAALEDFTFILKENIEFIYSKSKLIIDELPERLIIHHEKNDLKHVGSSGLRSKISKAILKLRTAFSEEPLSVKAKYKELSKYYLYKSLADNLIIFLNELERISYKLVSDFNNTQLGLITFIDQTLSKFSTEDIETLLKKEKDHFPASLEEHIVTAEKNYIKIKQDFLVNNRNNMQLFLNDLENIDVNSILRKRRLTKQQRTRNEFAADYSKYWNQNIKTLQSTISTQVLIEKLKGQGIGGMLELEENLQSEFSEKYTTPLIKGAKYLRDFNIDSQPSHFKVIIEEGINLRTAVAELIEKIQQEILKLPEEVEVTGEKFSEAVESIRFDEGEKVVVALRKLVDYSFESEFVAAIQNQSVNSQRMLRQAISEAKDSINLASFNLNEINGDEEKKSAEYIANLPKLAERITECSKLFEKVESEYLNKLHEAFNKSFEPLTSYSIIKSSSELSSHARELGGKKVLSKFSRVKESVYNYFQNILVLLFYKRSEGILFAKQIDKYQKDEFNATELLRFGSQLQPKKSVIKDLPHYYKKLFGGSSRVSAELWVGRRSELEQCRIAIERFNSGQGGSLLILGQRNDGKSALSKRFAELNFDQKNIFVVNAPLGGSKETDLFYKSIQKSLHTDEDIRSYLSNIKSPIAIVINDFELWWERSEDGFIVLSEIESLILSYGHKVFFIINCGSYSYSFIRLMYNLDHIFSGIVHCESFDAEELKDIILYRHRASGLKFVLNDVAEEKLSELKLAGLFNAYFDYSGGNIGMALNGWLGNIQAINGNVLDITYPSVPGNNQLSRLPEEWIFYLLQFVLHRRMNRKKAYRIIEEDTNKVDSILNKLLGFGLLTEREDGVLEINQVMEPFIIKNFLKTEIL